MANTKNNARGRASRRKMEAAYLELLEALPESSDPTSITVSQICACAGVHRSTFYAHYTGIKDLADSLVNRLREEIGALYATEGNTDLQALYQKMFQHLRAHRNVFRLYFRLGGIDAEMLPEVRTWHAEAPQGVQAVYHDVFHQAGFNAVARRWLDRGCPETPAQMAAFLMHP
ncbi:MAG: TetR/AcrR family transcriptional regulator [Eggerthellaceae bacterium]|jgi:AcrR family transcriptional regulator